jgi:type VI secretion system secreted protein VgrG
LQSGTYALNDFNFKTPFADLQVKSNVNNPHAQADYEVYDYPGEYIERGEGEAYSKARIEEAQQPYQLTTGQGDAAGVETGALFTLGGHGRDDQNMEYLIVSAQHQLSQGGYETNGSADDDEYQVSIQAMDSKLPYRAQRSTPKPTVQGPQTAMVVGKQGEEIWTDQYGRVKVQFHWDRYSKGDETSSCWIRVAQIWAGKNWGGMFIPRIGHEVIVEFLEGDPDRPIITGRVYNAAAMPPYELPANKTQSGIKSRSTKGGSGANFNEIRFEDMKGEEQVYIHAEKNQDNVVENDETTEVGHDRTENVGNDETVSIGRDRTENVGRDENLTIGRDRTLHVKQNQRTTIEKDQIEAVNNHRKETTYANHWMETGGHFEHITKGKYDLVAGTHIISKTTVHELSGSERVVFKGPGGTIILDSGGITLKGNHIALKAPSIAMTTGAPDMVESLSLAANKGLPICVDCMKAAAERAAAGE